MPSSKTGTTQYYEHLGILDKVRVIKGLVVFTSFGTLYLCFLKWHNKERYILCIVFIMKNTYREQIENNQLIINERTILVFLNLYKIFLLYV